MFSLTLVVLSSVVTSSVANILEQQSENLLGVREGFRSQSSSHEEMLACSRLSDGLSQLVTALRPHFKSTAAGRPLTSSSSAAAAAGARPSTSAKTEEAPFAPWTPSQLESLERTPFHRAGLARKMTLARRRLARPPERSGEAADPLQCDLCVLLVDQIQDLWAASQVPVLEEMIVQVCKRLPQLNARICKMIVAEYAPAVFYVWKHAFFAPAEICGFVYGFGEEGCGGYLYDPVPKWNVALPPTPKPPVRPIVPPPPTAPTKRILVLSDLHIDRFYQVGARAPCNSPACCDPSDGAPAPGKGAGQWGDYFLCDLPVWTLERMFQEIASKHQFDMIYLLGDIPSHHVWNQTDADQLASYRVVMQLMRKYFPGALFFPAIGNHESAPCNLFTPHSVRPSLWTSNWLYKYLASDEAWGGWLPRDPAIAADVEYYASYSTLVAPGFRVVSFSVNMCDTDNFWVYLNLTDPDGTLEWLARTLQRAEDARELVHIIGHIPPSCCCVNEWSRNYRRIVERYESTIAAQFFAHTHEDHFAIYYADDDADARGARGRGGHTRGARSGARLRPASAAYVFPSGTPYPADNSAFSIVTVAGFYANSTWGVLDKETYVLNISEANERNLTEWKHEYTFTEAYEVPNMLPASMSELTDRMLHDPSLVAKYYYYFHKMSPYQLECNPQDFLCRLTTVCELRSSVPDDKSACIARMGGANANEADARRHSNEGLCDVRSKKTLRPPASVNRKDQL